MGCADFIKKHFVGQKIKISVCDGETDTLIYDQHNFVNREYFEGIVIDCDCGIVVLELQDDNKIYINDYYISYFWQGQTNPYGMMKTAFSKKLHKIGKD